MGKTKIDWTEKLRLRFWSYVAIGEGCWSWKAGRFAGGYGQFRVGAFKVRAHRAAWTLIHGEISNRLCVLHRCDNPPCVNPAHLFLGTPADNAADRERKGRGNNIPPQGRPGASNPSAKLTLAEVEKIRRLSMSGVTQRELARLFGMSQSQIGNIVRRKSWTE